MSIKSKKILHMGFIFGLVYSIFVIVSVYFFMILARIADITQPAPGSGSFMIPLVILLLYPGIFLIRNPEAIFLIFLANIFCYFIFGTIIGLIIYFIKSRTIKPKLGLEN